MLVDDLLRSGRNLHEMKDLLESRGARVVALAVIVYQPTPRTRDFGELPLYHLAKLNASYYADASAIALDPEGNIFIAGIVPFPYEAPLVKPWQSGSGEFALVAQLGDGNSAGITQTGSGDNLEAFGGNPYYGNLIEPGFQAPYAGQFNGNDGAVIDGVGNSNDFTFVPEPATFVMAGLGMTTLLALRARSVLRKRT